MAYLDTDRSYGTPALAAMPGAGRFSALEWTTIALARRDTLGSIDRPGRMARALGSLFGFDGAPRLADPRLEALRRVAVKARYLGGRLPASEKESFLGAGFSYDQLRTLLATLVPAHAA